jgi:hypothetical protein
MPVPKMPLVGIGRLESPRAGTRLSSSPEPYTETPLKRHAKRIQFKILNSYFTTCLRRFKSSTRFRSGNYVHYLLWQYTAAKVAARVHAKERFDLVQHITWGNFRLPSFMWKLGVPFMFGPVAAAKIRPKKLRRGLGLRGRVWDFLRRTSNLLLTRGPLMKSTYAHATQIVATTDETLREIPGTLSPKG